MPFDAGVVLIKSTVCGFSMRKAIALVLLIVLGTMPLQTSAQVSVPAVDLQCLSDGPSEVPLILINLSETVLNDTAICKVTNPNTYAERIQIGVSADGLEFDAPVTIDLGPNSEESFNVTVSANQNITPGIRILNVTATVTEANGAPPPNTAESYTEGEIWIVNDEIIRSTQIEITEIGPFRSTTELFTTSNGIEYPVLYLKESFHIDAIMSGWNGTAIANKCLNIYVNPEQNTSPVITVNTSENGTIEWFSGDPLQNPTLRGIETTGGELEGLRTIRVAYEPDGGSVDACDAESSGDLSSSHTDIEVLIRSRTDLMLKESWGYFDADKVDSDGDGLYDSVEEYGIIEEDIVTGEVALLRDRLDLAVANEDIVFNFHYYSTSNDTWIFDHDETHFTNAQGIANFTWSAKYVQNDGCNGTSCNTKWKITASHPGSELFTPAMGNYTFEVIVLPPILDSDGDGVDDDNDAFPQDPEETHDDDGDGVGNNTDVFPQDPEEQFDNDGDGVGNNADEFPDNKYASNWSTIYAAVGTLLALLFGAGVMISRMKKQDELPTVASSSELQQLDKQIEELQQKKNEMIAQEDVTERMFNDD
tara:strand:+ start:503 stop:2278 length:1776 start_codon:yes stop_codon:yes gene_type:complete